MGVAFRQVRGRNTAPFVAARGSLFLSTSPREVKMRLFVAAVALWTAWNATGAQAPIKSVEDGVLDRIAGAVGRTAED